jgi:LysM repeat protein
MLPADLETQSVNEDSLSDGLPNDEEASPQKNHRLFWPLLLLHLIPIAGCVGYYYFGRENGKSPAEAALEAQAQNAPKAKILDETLAAIPRGPLPNYTVQPGDSFNTLAAERNTTVEMLQQSNPGVERLFVGQNIYLPPKPQVIEPGRVERARIISENENPADLVDVRKNTNKFAINENLPPNDPPPYVPELPGRPQAQPENPPTPPKIPRAKVLPEKPRPPEPKPELRPTRNTQEAKANKSAPRPVPASRTSAAKPGKSVTVKAGDTIYSLSRRSGMGEAEFMRYNGLKDSTLRVGQRLKMPPTP